MSSTESHLQEAIAKVLPTIGVPFEREKRLGGLGVVDFLVAGSIALEVKIKGQQGEVLRQLFRYAQAEEVAGLLLISTKPAHVRFLPEEMRGKPVRSVLVGYLG